MAVNNIAPYSPIFNLFKTANSRYEVLSDVKFAQALSSELPEFGKTANSTIGKVITKAFISWLDKDFKLQATDEAGNPKLLISSINLLTLWDQFINQRGSTRSIGVFKASTIDEKIAELRDALIADYTSTELANQNSQDLVGQAALTEEQRKEKALQGINKDPIYSPTYRSVELAGSNAISGQSGVVPSATPIIDEALGLSSVGGNTFEDYLRMNPGSSFLDLVAMYTPTGGTLEDKVTWGSVAWGPRPGVATKDAQGNDVEWSPDKFVSYLWDLQDNKDVQKIAEIQTFLAKAGYFAKNDVYPTPRVVDTATQTAWIAFLTDAAINNLSIEDAVARGMTMARQAQELGTGIKQSDPLVMKKLGDQIAIDILGRDLSTLEEALLMKKIKEWEAEVANPFLTGNLQPTEFDINARIEDYIVSQNKQEAAALKYDAHMQEYKKRFGID